MISCYDLEDNLITIFESYKECAKWFNTSVEVIYCYICRSQKGIVDKKEMLKIKNGIGYLRLELLMISNINELQKGDLVIYRNGRTNYVNKPYKYQMWYNSNFKHREFGSDDDIVEIKRYIKGRFFYKLKTIYKRGDSNV